VVGRGQALTGSCGRVSDGSAFGIAQELSEAARITKDRLTREHPADTKDDVVLVSESVQQVTNLAGTSVRLRALPSCVVTRSPSPRYL
jgi:hypothetical protein